MAFKAQVKLSTKGPRSIDRKGLRLRQGQLAYVTNASEVRRLQADPQFVVTIVEGKLPVAMAKTEPPPPPEDDDDESAGDPSPDEDDEGEVDGLYTKKDLNAQTKSELIALAASEFDLELDQSAKKAALVEAILDAQAEKSEDDGED
jgi:hypothetical protein